MRAPLLTMLALLAPVPSADASFAVMKLGSTVKASARMPAVSGAGGVVLPVLAGTTTAERAVLRHAGGVTIQGVRLTRLQTDLGRRDRITAVVGGKRREVFRLVGKARTDRTKRTVVVDAKLVPAGPLRKRLGTKRRGSFTADVALPKPLAKFTRPPGAVDLTSSSFTWHVRESFIRYLAAGEGATASRGATAGEPRVAEGTDAPLVYDFAFAPAGGWSDAATGKALLRFTGTVRFRYRDHGIDLRARDPELRVDGARTVAVFTLSGAADTGVPARRDALFAVAGGTEKAPGTVTAAGSDLLAGFYNPGDPFGAASFAFAS